MASHQLSMVTTWAADNGYRIISNEPCYLDMGPFRWRYKGQQIFKLVVEKDGAVRTFYARTGTGIDVLPEGGKE